MENNSLESLLRKILSYSTPQVCKHAICLDVIDMAQRCGIIFDNELIRAISDADDETSLRILGGI